MLALVDPQTCITSHFADWYPATRESVLKGPPVDAYRGAKTLAEQTHSGNLQMPILIWRLDVSTGTTSPYSYSWSL